MMLDFRIKTFLELCRLKSYTKTAEYLHITQPAVTQHIQYLEREFHTSLFDHNARELTLTPKGNLLYWSALTMEANSRKVQELLEEPDSFPQHLKFGVTLSIGEYIMPEILSNYLQTYPEHRISMLTENTEHLLKELNKGRIDFAVIEGWFDKDAYSHVLFSNERFLAVCAKNFKIEETEPTIDDMVKYPLIIREKGSGTRAILEDILREHNLALRQFHHIHEIGNFKTIKHLVKSGVGITFAYEPVIRQEIKEGILKKIPIHNFKVEREFNLVYLKNNIFEKEYLEFVDWAKEIGSIHAKRLI